MATLYTDVYGNFLSKVTDYSFINLNNKNELEPHLYNFLKTAIVHFDVSCRNDLTLDDTNQSFTVDLTHKETEILATLMVVNYLTHKIVDVKNMEQIVSDSEFKVYSQANHLKEMINLKKELQKDVTQLINVYSYQGGLLGLLQ